MHVRRRRRRSRQIVLTRDDDGRTDTHTRNATRPDGVFFPSGISRRFLHLHPYRSGFWAQNAFAMKDGEADGGINLLRTSNLFSIVTCAHDCSISAAHQYYNVYAYSVAVGMGAFLHAVRLLRTDPCQCMQTTYSYFASSLSMCRASEQSIGPCMHGIKGLQMSFIVRKNIAN